MVDTKKCCLVIGGQVSEGMSNLWGAYAGNIVTNHKTAFFCVDQSQCLKSAKRERGREREISDIKKAPLLRRAALKIDILSAGKDYLANLACFLAGLENTGEAE